jgi:hypothetical protein
LEPELDFGIWDLEFGIWDLEFDTFAGINANR